MRCVGVVGSGVFKSQKIVIYVLNHRIDKENDIIVSGNSPRNKYNNVDVWAEKWALDNCKEEPIIYDPFMLCPENNVYYPDKTPEEYKRWCYDKFFMRNRLIAFKSDILLCFIPKDLYKSGVWNTIKWFSLRDDFDLANLFIYDEKGLLWQYDKYPQWVIKNSKKIKEKNIF